MKIKLIIIGIGLIIFAIGGCSLQTPAPQTSTLEVSSQSAPKTQKSKVQTSKQLAKPKTPAPQPTKEFTLTAKQWSFSPSKITVNKGDKVILHIKSIDVTHGFQIDEFGVSKTLSPGKTVDVQFAASKTGTFSFFCNVFCGSGHGGMNGKLIVK